MQWGHIKTLFILSFLILNIYLVFQFVQKQQDADLGIIFSQETTIEDQLEADNIKIPKLDMNVKEETYILTSEKVFDEKELEKIQNKDDRQTVVINGNFIVSQLEEPIPIPKNASNQEISDLVKGQIFFPDEFVYWDWHKELNVLIFFQQIEGRTVYYNEHGPGLLLVYLNDKNEITHYTETLLNKTDAQGSGSKPLIQPMQAIEALYNSNDLHPNEEVTKIKLGYYSRLIEEGEQVFAPTWNVTVNGERNYFINAIEGFIFSSIDKTFLDTMIEDNIFKIHSLNDEEEKEFEPFLDMLNKKQQFKNRSEIEK
ncbi:two-component system regulatory protein YycI [Oceanobacillus sp. Castelsardo]|uniref:two-component system regulatory protein YycI n=1 Tax=Oceanobacillus sp. Castelsardo TaxID=1851204 RepID=UPI0008394517|nr:two-component system regulatory protein YycI [Oceanobacillus sp. Castelsardo]